MKRICAMLLIGFLGFHNVVADEYLMKNECQENQINMNACANEFFKFYDTKLNKLYQAQMSYLTIETNKKELKDAQLAWLKFRDADCKYEAGGPEAEHGSGWAWNYYSCLGNRTKERVLQLEKYIDCRGGGCPI